MSATSVHLHHAVAYVAILHARYSGYHLNAFDVGRRDVACGCRLRLAHAGIVVQTHSVYLDSCAECGVASLARSGAQRHARVVRQSGVDGLSAGQQSHDVVER